MNVPNDKRRAGQFYAAAMAAGAATLLSVLALGKGYEWYEAIPACLGLLACAWFVCRAERAARRVRGERP